MITVNELSFSYGKREIFKNLTFEVEAGKCTVIAGPNGSGKSTVLSVIAGALKPTDGTVASVGNVGYIPQGTALFEDATVEENLCFFAGLTGGEIPKMLPFSVEEYLKRKVSKLSGGMKKQVSIACALVGDPPIILLDEPCAALDIAFRDEMIAIIKEWKRIGKAIVYVGHDPAEFYAFFDNIIFLDLPPRKYTRAELGESGTDERGFVEFFKKSLINIKRK